MLTPLFRGDSLTRLLTPVFMGEGKGLTRMLTPLFRGDSFTRLLTLPWRTVSQD